MNKLEMKAITMYWCEGTKIGRTVDFTNTDLDMLKIWISYLRSRKDIEPKRIKIQVMTYPDADVTETKKFWSRKLGIPLEQFNQVFVKSTKSAGTYKNKKNMGTVKIRYNSKKLMEDIVRKIDALK